MTFEGEGEDSKASEYAVEKLLDWNHNYLVNNIASFDDHLIVADQYSSVSLLKLNARQKLATIARDYSSLWPVAIDALDKESIIGGDVSVSITRVFFAYSNSLGRSSNRSIFSSLGRLSCATGQY